MPLQKVKADSNMYQGWVTHTHSHMAGECPHRCSYCYVKAMERRWKTGRYAGDSRMVLKEFEVNYGINRTIFIDHMTDLWAEAVPEPVIDAVLDHVRKYHRNVYVFQTKNPGRYLRHMRAIPWSSILGCTIETNRWYPAVMAQAPDPFERAAAMQRISGSGMPGHFRTFVTIEPILDFDPIILARMIEHIQPEFVNIGADSKGCGLPEPTADKIETLLAMLADRNIEVKQKSNLSRLLKT